MSSTSDWIVLKFGGPSVSTREQWETIARIVRERLEAGLRPLVVCSAMSGVSRLLESLWTAALRGDHADVLTELRERHAALAEALGLDAEALLAPSFETLDRLALGISLTQEVPTSLRARILAQGELMLTTLGAAYLQAQDLRTDWYDARDALPAAAEPAAPDHRRYLAAVVPAAPDADLRARLAAMPADVLLTQGFIARGAQGETVLLGWGGSDTSAAAFAAKLQAVRLEIWTDVPGLFTANPRRVPSARLLRRLDYDEAEELASMGAEVLHPRSVDPLRPQGIPLHIRSILAPDLDGTVVSPDAPDFGPQVKGLSMRTGLTLVEMESAGMWHQVGFLARAFAVFERHDLSVDLIATSERNVTVSLDASTNPREAENIRALLAELNGFCEAREIGPCAAVSLVGRHIQTLLHELGPALVAFDEQRIHLVTQSASGLNFTFVVDEREADRVVRALHASLFGAPGVDALYGPTWRELFVAEPEQAAPAAWWQHRREELLAVAEEASPRYVYDAETLRARVADVQSLDAVDRAFYAMKANPHPDVLRVFHKAGLGFECVSPGELDRVRRLFPGLEEGRLLYTPNFAGRADYAAGYEAGAAVTLDNVYPLEAWPDVFAGRELILRLDPGRGHGHHKHVRTAGPQSKFGISPDELERVRELAREADVRIVGLHAHVGSGITSAGTWSDTAVFLGSLADAFPDLRLLNLGGGLGVPERPGTSPLDIEAVAERLRRFKASQPAFDLWLEPGRYLVAEAGVLLARVTQIKRKGSVHYIGVDTGMNSLIRPALYGSYHEIVNLTRLGEPLAIEAEVVGPICETGDVLGHGRRLPETHEGDVLLIATAGAYGRAMSSHYNLRAPAEERMLA